MSIKIMVENPHPVNRKYSGYWNFLLDSYEGGLDYTGATVSGASTDNGVSDLYRIYANGTVLSQTTNSHLFKHPKELDRDFKDRVKMSYYYNFSAPILDTFTDHLFKQNIVADFNNIEKIVEKRKNNIDRKGSSLTEFRKEMADLSQLYGHVFIVVDSPQSSDDIVTVQDQIDKDVFAYFAFIHPQNMVNWALDPFGRPYWVLVREMEDANIDPMQYDKDLGKAITYRLITRDSWYLYNSKYELISSGLNRVGYVPIVCVVDKRSKKEVNFLGISALSDIAFITRDVFNSCSELKQILRDQTFAFLTVQGESSEYSEIEIGTRKGLIYPRDTDRPGYISPPASNAEAYFKHIDRQVVKMFQLAKIEAGSAKFDGESAVAQSGVSKAWDFNQTNSSLARKASNFEDGEMKLWEFFSLWEISKSFDGHIDYPKEFSVASLTDDLDELEKTMKAGLGKEFDKEVKKAIVKKKFPRMAENDLNVMLDDIDNNEGKGEGDKLVDKLPNLFKKNANSGGK